MTLNLACATVAGGFLLPFLIRMMWGPMVDNWKALGGWMAATFIVGIAWAINHGIPTPMITQSGTVWVDQALSVGIGVWLASALTGGKVRQSLKNVFSAILGGTLGGFLLSLFL
ncbi:hypothetical protein M0J71_RS00190 [Citrobacter freundii]|jgi:hypothetical protein|uniref:Lin0368 family putative glycerol transporter subunit n=1 Tax=Citrobacter freundii TaxID=546 RepID=UPI000029D7F0|nr:hypothetical protein [Citrobacter freundii]EJD6091729.1 hypothetical protein [Citrobacter freundii]